MFSPLQYIVLPPGTLRRVCLCLWSCGPVRSCFCWGTAAIEITGIAHGSGGRVRDELTLSPPAFPKTSTLSRGGSLRFSSSPLRESALICSSFLSKEIYIVFYSEWLACCRGNACITVIIGSLYESFTSDRVYSSGCLTAFNLEELIMHFNWLWKVSWEARHPFGGL